MADTILLALADNYYQIPCNMTIMVFLLSLLSINNMIKQKHNQPRSWIGNHGAAPTNLDNIFFFNKHSEGMVTMDHLLMIYMMYIYIYISSKSKA